MNHILTMRKIGQGMTANESFVNYVNLEMWYGRRVYILGGGPSLKTFNTSVLKGKRVIAVNRAFELGNSDLMYFMDTTFPKRAGIISNPDDVEKALIADLEESKEVKKKWEEYSGIKVCLCPLGSLALPKDVKVVRRAVNCHVTYDVGKGIYGGNNSGFGAIMLAIALGVSEICLLGYDLRVAETTHYHSGYVHQERDKFAARLKVFKKMFDVYAREMQKKTVIWNCTKNSSLTCFDYKRLKELL